jgi:small subunit ribosomal protein S17
MTDEEKKDAVDETPADPGREAEESALDGEAGSPSEEQSQSDSPATSEGGDAPAAEEAEASSDDSPDEGEAPAPAAEESPEDDLPWKERRRLERSRRPHETGPQLSDDERAAKRAEARKAKSALRRKQRAALKAEGGAAGTGTAPADHETNAAKVRQGIVVSDKGEKSITVRIDSARRHPTYEKVVRRSRTLHAHDERNEAGEGDTVRVVETRPLSKTKRWRLVEVLEKAK